MLAAFRSGEIRTLVDWTLRPHLLAVHGVAEVNVFGGDVRQWQVQVDPERLMRYGLSIADVVQAAHSVVVVSAPGLGDEIQAIKAGVLEIADIDAELNRLAHRRRTLPEHMQLTEAEAAVRAAPARRHRAYRRTRARIVGDHAVVDHTGARPLGLGTATPPASAGRPRKYCRCHLRRACAAAVASTCGFRITLSPLGTRS